MNLTELKNKLPDYAKDIKLNLSMLTTDEEHMDLTTKQIQQIMLATAFATKNFFLIQQFSNEMLAHLSIAEIDAAKAAATMMSMTNIYYRFLHLVSDKSFSSLPAKLRMNIIAQPGIDKVDFELSCLAVSALNGCGLCIDAHTKELLKHGLTQIAIQSAIRIASVMNAAAMSLEIETTISP